MQLFISDQRSTQTNTTTISDPRIIHQCHTVLRMKTDDIFLLQATHWIERHTFHIQIITKKEIIWHISHTDTYSQPVTHTPQLVTICIALPNRIDKAELIVQKLTEIGTRQIIFFTAQRSAIRELKEKTLQRLHTIALEATEQSFWRSLPDITYHASLGKLLAYTTQSEYMHILLDHHGENREKISKNINKDNKSIYAYIWPEWWFSEEEKDQITNPTEGRKSSKLTKSLTLWSTNLRMETASIITWRLLQNF